MNSIIRYIIGIHPQQCMVSRAFPLPLILNYFEFSVRPTCCNNSMKANGNR